MNIKAKNEKLIIDGQEKKTSDLNQEFLNHIVSESLRGNVQYELEGDHPLVKFFQALHEGTKEGSVLRQKMNEMETACAAIEADDVEKSEANEGEAQERNNKVIDDSLQD